MKQNKLIKDKSKNQKTINNFFAVNKEENNKATKCSACSESIPTSRLVWHRDFDCKFRKLVKKDLKNPQKLVKRNKNIKKTLKLSEDGDSDIEIITVESDTEESESQRNDSGQKEDFCDEISHTYDENSDQDLLEDEITSLNKCNSYVSKPINENIKDILDDWTSPEPSPIKMSTINKEETKPKDSSRDKDAKDSNNTNDSLDRKDFSFISEEDSDEDFCPEIKFNLTPKKMDKQCVNSKKDLGKLQSSPNCSIPKSPNSINKINSDIGEEKSNSSYDGYLCSPRLVSPCRTPTPSPNLDRNKTDSNRKLKLSPYLRSSPKKFNLIKRFSEIRDSAVINKIQNSPNNSIKSPLKNDPQQNTNVNPETTFESVCKNLEFEELKPTKFQSTHSSPQKFRGVNGMYLDNFLHIKNVVMSQPEDAALFNDDDKTVINNFSQLSLQAQKLYVRLFQRKIKWNKTTRLEYKDICDKEDMYLYVNELIYSDFLLSGEVIEDLKEVLQLVDVADIRKLCKDMKVLLKGCKDDLMERLVNFDRQQISVAFSFKSREKNSKSLLFKKAKKMVGSCSKINKEVWDVFMRVLLIYSPVRFDEDEENGLRTHLTALLLASIGKMKFPVQSIHRSKSIFRSREDVLMYQTVMQLEFEIQDHLALQNWEAALEVCASAKELMESMEDIDKMRQHSLSLPSFLRRFTTLSLLVYIQFLAVEAHQRLKHYTNAVHELESLLSQKIYLQDSRGRWYDRLAVNLHQHLKNPRKCLKVIKEALNDPEVRVGHRLSLSLRAERLLNSKGTREMAQNTLSDQELMTFEEAPEVVIQGKCLPADIPGYKRIFLSSSGLDGDAMCSVEEFVVKYYKDQGYPRGLHAEGKIVGVLFGVFFWDIIYDSSIPDAFRSPHQGKPLDLDSPHFYASRKERMDVRLQEIENWCIQDAHNVVKNVWEKHKDEVSLVDWNLFSSFEYLQGLVSGLGLPLIAAMCGRVAKDHRFTRSGFPDLVVWNPENKISRIVEVKGPNDKLSTKQMLWLDFLIKHGASAEVCHVEAVGAKRVGLKNKSISESTRVKANQNKVEENDQDTEEKGKGRPKENGKSIKKEKAKKTKEKQTKRKVNVKEKVVENKGNAKVKIYNGGNNKGNTKDEIVNGKGNNEVNNIEDKRRRKRPIKENQLDGDLGTSEDDFEEPKPILEPDSKDEDSNTRPKRRKRT